MFKKIIEYYHLGFKFITHDIWDDTTYNTNKSGAILIKMIKVIIVAARGFMRDKVNQQASSLTLYLLMSIVPIAALIFAIAKGFGIDDQIKQELLTRFEGQGDLITSVLGFAESAISSAKGGVLAGVGIAFLLYSSMNMLVQIETSFNSIWRISRPRSWSRRFADYLSIMLIAPIMLLMASSLTVTFKYYLHAVTNSLPFISNLAPIAYKIIPFALMWFLFTGLYVVMPNTKVKFSAAMIAGIVAGSIFQLLEQFYFYSQVSISKYNAIYGSLAAVPLFLMWAKLSWQVVLFGAELSYAYQNIDNYELEIDTAKISHHDKRLISLYIMQYISKNFMEGKPAFTAHEIAHQLDLSTRSVRLIIDVLTDCGLLAEVVMDNNKENAFLPAVDVHKLTITFVLQQLDGKGLNIVKEDAKDEIMKLSNILDDILKNYGDFGGNKKLIEI